MSFQISPQAENRTTNPQNQDQHNTAHIKTHAKASTGLSLTQQRGGCIENQAPLDPALKKDSCGASFRPAKSPPPSDRPRRCHFCTQMSIIAAVYPPLSSNRLDSTHWCWPMQGGGPNYRGHPPPRLANSIFDDAKVSSIQQKTWEGPYLEKWWTQTAWQRLSRR
jgi:hypothetical protein